MRRCSTADSEASTLGGRVKRYARVGRAMGGLAVELAGKRYLGIKLDRSRHAGELAAALGDPEARARLVRIEGQSRP